MNTEQIKQALKDGRAALQYVKGDEAWYTRAVDKASRYRSESVREWSVGVAARTETGHPNGTCGQWMLRWYELGNGAAVRLEAFSDSFAAFLAVPGFLEALEAAGDDPAAVEAALVGLGFTDATERTSPWARTGPWG